MRKLIRKSKYYIDELDKMGYKFISKGRTLLRISCREHGIFDVSYDDPKCPQCRWKSLRLTYEYVKEQVEKRGYELVSKRYVQANSKLRIRCWHPRHRVFEISYGSFSQGVGCAQCAQYGFNPNKPAILYYLAVLHRKKYYYKIGITNNSVHKRYRSRSDRKKITVIAEWHYKKGRDARDEEQSIIENFQDYLYNGRAAVLEGAAGNAELFTRDVLGLT